MKTLLCALCSVVAFAAASSDSKAEKEILAAMDTYKESAIMYNHTAALEKILGDDLLFTIGTGSLKTRLRCSNPPPARLTSRAWSF